jgi:hypothetical protein
MSCAHSTAYYTINARIGTHRCLTCGYQFTDPRLAARPWRPAARRTPRPSDGPTVHFSSDTGAGDLVEMGPAICWAGLASRTEHDQYVVGNWESVTCGNCRRMLAAHNRREAREAKQEDR